MGSSITYDIVLKLVLTTAWRLQWPEVRWISLKRQGNPSNNYRCKTSPLDQELQHIEVEGGTIDLELFRCEKIEKVVLSGIKVHETGVTDETVIIWPDASHNFPALWCTLTIIPSVMNIPIIDIVPMMDFVVWPEYAEK